MKFSTTAGAFREALTTARHAVTASPSLVAHTGVLLRVKNSQMAAIGSDGETTISALLQVMDSADGQVLLPPKPLANYLGALESSTAVTLTAEEGKDVEVRAGTHAPYKFRPVASTFPLPTGSKPAPVAVRLERLPQALMSVKSSVARESPGVQIISNEEGLFLHSTDNYRLSRAFLPEAGFGDFQGVVPLGVLDRIARSEITSVSVDSKIRTLHFAGPSVLVSSRLLTTTFPAIDGMLSNIPDSKVSFATADLTKSLAGLAAVAEDEPLYCSIEHDLLTLSVSNADLGSGEETVSLHASSEVPFKFAVKLNYLLDAANSHDSGTVSLAWTTATSPLFLLSDQNVQCTTIVMPMQV